MHSRFALAGFGLLTCTAALAGCGVSNPLIGKWTTTTTIGPVKVTSTREFKADGTETMALGSLSETMTYRVSGDQLYDKASSASLGNPSVTVDTSKVSPQERAETFTISGNALTISDPNGQAVTYQRAP